MDVAYDHIQEEILASNNKNDNNNNNNNNNKDNPESTEPPKSNTDNDTTKPQEAESNFDLNAEFQETFRALSTSAWGVRIGGFFDNVRKQGESYYEGARQEYAAASEEAAKGISDLKENIVGRTRGLSLSTAFAGNEDENENEKKDEAQTPTATKTRDVQQGQPQEETGKKDGSGSGNGGGGEGFLARLKAEASKRLKEIEKAEDAADEAILRFGMNIGQKLREAISIVPPDEEGQGGGNKGQLLFESKDSEGKRVIHATRLDAQLHIIHKNLENFTKDPVNDKWPAFQAEFNVDNQTNTIASDLEAYPELRSAMEKLVPEKVEYSDFWRRYYFLRNAVETEEKKRKELLKGAVNDEEEVTWDDDSDSDAEEAPATPQGKPNKASANTNTSTSTTSATPNHSDSNPSDKDTLLKPAEPRRSNDQQSQAGSESSYDLVSGNTSRAPESPKEKPSLSKTEEDSDEEDWE